MSSDGAGGAAAWASPQTSDGAPAAWNAIEAGSAASDRRASLQKTSAVSYTHLTLPTICSV